MLWLRYRDDIFDLWTQGVEKLLEFTNYINSLYHTIKFELVYSEGSLNVLDLTLLLQDGFISTDILIPSPLIVICICPTIAHTQIIVRKLSPME